MAKCPRCTAAVPAYTRCDGCGLVLGFDGFTVLIEFEDSPGFRRVWRMARRQDSCSEWTEENGRQFLRVTYSLAELGMFRELAEAAVRLSRKHSFLNGLEIRWPAPENGDSFSPEFPLSAAAVHQNRRYASSSH
jgi:hypothetical protein